MSVIKESNIHTYVNPLEGKTVIISGGTTGIGRATAVLLAAYGTKLLIYGRHKRELNDALREIEKACNSGAEVTGIVADQSSPADVKKIFRKADHLWDRLDIMINNAALGGTGILDMKENDWRYVVESNLFGYMDCSRQAALRMKDKKSGHIVNVGSMSADEREAESSVYVATKSAIQGFSESLRKELNPLGIKVTLIEPGKVGTDMQEESPRQQRIKEEKGEMLKAQDIAVCIHYCLTQPERCDVVEVKIRPHMQLI